MTRLAPFVAAWVFASTFLLLAGPSCRGQAGSSLDVDRVRAEIQAICTAENAALARKDLDAAFAPYAPDWEVLDADGSRRTLEQDREATIEVFRVLKAFRPSTTIERVTMSGSDALVVDRSAGDMDVENANTGKKAHIRYSMVSEVTWRRSGSSWLAYRTRVLSRKRWVDGKLVTDQEAARAR